MTEEEEFETCIYVTQGKNNEIETLKLFFLYGSKGFITFAPKMSEFMIGKDEVQRFLDQFNTKMKVFGIIYRDDRGKNRQTLEALEIVPMYRRVVIESLTVEDYVQGPLIDELNRLGEMWVFGKDVKGREIYIKIMMGCAGSQTICISFHIAEHPLSYPFKTVEE